MRYLTRRLVGFCSVLVFLTCLDCALTLAGQPAEYWAGNRTQTNELNPINHWLLARHPLAFVAGKAATLSAFISLILLMPRISAMVLSILLSLVNLSGPGTWLLNLPGHPGYHHGVEMFWSLVLLTVVGMAVGIRWAWLAKSSGIWLPYGLRYGAILMLFAIWLIADFLSTRQLGSSGLIAILPILLLFGGCSYELFREMRQQEQKLG